MPLTFEQLKQRLEDGSLIVDDKSYLEYVDRIQDLNRDCPSDGEYFCLMGAEDRMYGYY
jgi:hypothetical protein